MSEGLQTVSGGLVYGTLIRLSCLRWCSCPGVNTATSHTDRIYASGAGLMVAVYRGHFIQKAIQVGLIGAVAMNGVVEL